MYLNAVRSRREAGFTLIELMIVVAIIGIIAAIAYPSYVENVRQARRATSQADLMELAQWMERQYAADFSYLEGGAAPILPFTRSPRNGTAFYNLSFSGAGVAQNTYTLQAVPTGDQTNDRCGTMGLTQTGAKTAAAPGCW
ncbi:type IV pilin protein [Marinobacter sp. KMM 10035]|uniref:type IV pilin protein n=1 Tax=Marinobacter sp. KMM 10035 TaxID=3134034 RepID=UPI0039784CB4